MGCDYYECPYEDENRLGETPQGIGDMVASRVGALEQAAYQRGWSDGALSGMMVTSVSPAKLDTEFEWRDNALGHECYVDGTDEMIGVVLRPQSHGFVARVVAFCGSSRAEFTSGWAVATARKWVEATYLRGEDKGD